MFRMGCAAIMCVLSACASVESLGDTPSVRLHQGEGTDMSLDGQTLLLGFHVSNPNPFPLPIRTVSYGVELDGYRLASGETQSEFTVPAGSDGDFAISVDVNLLKLAPQLLFIVREGHQRDIPYTLTGTFDVDIPFTHPVAFSNEGNIRLQAALF